MKKVLVTSALLLAAVSSWAHENHVEVELVTDPKAVIETLTPVTVDDVTMVALPEVASSAETTAPVVEAKPTLVQDIKSKFNSFVAEVQHYFDEGMAEAEAEAKTSETPTEEAEKQL